MWNLTRPTHHDTLKHGLAFDAAKGKREKERGDTLLNFLAPRLESMKVAVGEDNEESSVKSDNEFDDEDSKEKATILAVSKVQEAPVEEPDSSARKEPKSYFSPEEARSASEVCDQYRQVLNEHYVFVGFDNGNSISLSDEDDDDCMSIFSDLGSLAATSDMNGSFLFFDEDSIVVRRHQMDAASNTPSPPCGIVHMESLHRVDAVIDAVISMDG